MAIKYYKLNMLKVISQSAAILLLAQIVLFCIIAITRIPIGRLTIPMVILVFLLTVFGLTCNLEKKLTKKKVEENKDNKRKNK